MRCLWLTRFLPYPPFYGGDAIYSSKLIKSLAEAGVKVTVICYNFGQTETVPPREQTNIEWHILSLPDLPIWMTVLTLSPSIAQRFKSRDFIEWLEITLNERSWDAVVVDHISMGWVVDFLPWTFTREPPRPLLIYVSHNHEGTVRKQLARDFTGNPLKRLALWLEGIKAAQLENRLVRHSDLVTVNTNDDAALFRRDHPEKHYLTLLPGYDGAVIKRQTITSETPRKATIVGSFGWLAKRMNLDAFLRLAAPKFAAAGAELEILGNMPESYKSQIQREFPSVQVRGTFAEIEPYLANSRLGIVPELTGGGFKHKVLSYVFCRVPIAALDGAVSGTPLRPGTDILYFPDMNALVDGCLEVLDDPNRLNQLQQSAYEACSGQFNWADRGEKLAAIIGYQSSPKIYNR